MSGTKAAKITGFVCENGAAVASGTTLRFKWNTYSGADDFRMEAATDGKTFASWGRTGGPTAAFSKGGAADAGYTIRVTARRGGADIAGSTSDVLTVRIGPAPVVQPTPTPTPAPTYATAADLAALAARVAALEKVQAATGGTAPAGVLPADLPRGGGVVTGDGTLVVRAGEVVVATAK